MELKETKTTYTVRTKHCNNERGEENTMTTREMQEVINKALNNFSSNIDYAYSIGEEKGTFAEDYDKAWDTLDEDIKILNLSDTAKAMLYEAARHLE